MYTLKTREIMVSEACRENLEEIVKLLSQLSPPGPEGEVDKEAGKKILEKMIFNPDYYVCIAKIDNETAGTATLLVQWNLSHGGQPYAHLENVVTNARCRSNGIGSAMVRFLLEKARQRGCYKVILNCEPENIPFYANCGFHETAEVEMRIAP